MQTIDFPHGYYYLILTKLGQQALTMEAHDSSQYDNSRIIAQTPNSQNDRQLFMIEKVGDKDDQFEIVNCISTLVFDQESSLIRLKFGKRHSDQLFAIEQAPIINNKLYYWIKTSIKGTRSLKFDQYLKYGPFNKNDQSQLFQFKQISTNNTIMISALIVNNMTGKALDVPRASRKQGQRLIQWQKNKRWNQRWRFQRRGPGVAIYSILNNYCVDVCGASKKSGAEVIQWVNNGGTNQLWIPQPCGNGLYKFKAYHEPSLFLSIKKEKTSNGAEVEVCSHENSTMYWRVEGAKP